jgi:hypothetical protein
MPVEPTRGIHLEPLTGRVDYWRGLPDGYSSFVLHMCIELSSSSKTQNRKK